MFQGITFILNRFKEDERNTVIRMMEVIAPKGSISNAEARAETGKSKPSITRLLSKMRDRGLFTSEGARPAIRYRKTNQN